MKILGLSFGRVMKNSELLLKEALMEAERLGAEVEFMRLLTSDIRACTGCGGCHGEGSRIKCVLKDDFAAVEEAYMDCDALIVAAPVYVLGPTGILKNLADRFGPSHDKAALIATNERRKAEGKELLDERYLKQRYGALISVGGAMTQNWVSFGLTGMHLLTFPLQVRIVDQIDAYAFGLRANPLLDDELLTRTRALAQHVVESVGKPLEEAQWYGEEGTCPVCHLNHITIKNGSTVVECPLCGIQGKLSIVDGKIKVDFPEESYYHSRLRLGGLEDHQNEFKIMGPVSRKKMEDAKDKLPGMLEKYRKFDEGHLRKLK